MYISHIHILVDLMDPLYITHIPRQLYLIYWNWCQQTPSVGVGRYWVVSKHTEMLSLRKNKTGFFQGVAVSILLYGCTTWMITNRKEEKLDENCTRMLRAAISKSWNQYLTKTMYGHWPPIAQIIQVKRTKLAGHCWRNKL